MDFLLWDIEGTRNREVCVCRRQHRSTLWHRRRAIAGFDTYPKKLSDTTKSFVGFSGRLSGVFFD
jgi:hypothetical protein